MEEERIEEDRNEIEEEPLARATVAWFLATVVAAGIGVLVGLIMAPTSGRETRRIVRRRVKEEAAVVERKVRRVTGDVGRQAKRRVENTLDQGKQALAKLHG